ncbi:hypothetical protein [Macrococcoides caseolyticum]|uniref:hypothetical protein n=1 Tax=Macrococcoides caseolyticum TaxID=69966 RepID=UPI0018E1864D|nr:hypothetical protein [Macrococcus caseolyticus]QQB06151.1 hypothetical protein I6H62_03020 [Macrococcus caseolyticus]
MMRKRKTAHVNIPPFLIDGSNRLENFVLNNINIYKKLGYRDIWFNVMIIYNQDLEEVLRINGIRSYGMMFDGSFHHSKVSLNPTWIDKIRCRLNHTKTE